MKIFETRAADFFVKPKLKIQDGRLHRKLVSFLFSAIFYVNMLQIGTFNCQGLLDETKKDLLVRDFCEYNLDILAVQETHMKNHGIEKFHREGKHLDFFYSGNDTSNHGVGIFVNSKLPCKFKHINERICYVEIKIENENRILYIISAYAPTAECSKKHPEKREEFYSTLDSIVNSVSNRNYVFICGDFNAKTGSAFKDYTENMGFFGKGTVNENGTYLLEFAKQHNLMLTNTVFEHKKCHRTTWTAPERICTDAKSGMPRRNPYRNQIDYICVRDFSRLQVLDSRSYGGTRTHSDHKMVVAKVNLKWKPTKFSKTKTRKINYDGFSDQNNQKKYQEELKLLLDENPVPENLQDRWTRIVNITQQAAEKTVGIKKPDQKNQNPEIRRLSDEQKRIRSEIQAAQNKDKRDELRKERNQSLQKIHQILEKEKKEKLENKLLEMEKYKNDSAKCFQAVKEIRRAKPSNLLIKDPTSELLVSNEKEQNKIITEHFKKQFFTDANHLPEIEPTAMETPFTKAEIEKAVKRLKLHKSPGEDEVCAELLRYGTHELYDEIAEILNNIASSGEFPKELNQGLLAPLQKPGKPKGPTENLRPIILFSIFRKILAICMLDRISTRLSDEIPLTQAAYRKGRSTTEQTFTVKTLAEWASTSKEEHIFLLMTDMSKAFDTINRGQLLSDLDKILKKEELHLLKILLNVELAVKNGTTKGDFFATDTGAPQGDCLSAVQFTYYLAKTLEEHQNHSVPATEGISLDVQYADDISLITTNKALLEQTKENLPEILTNRELKVNTSKTEEYTIERNGDESWRQCKFLGTKLDTNNEIKRRKGLAIDAIRTLKSIFQSSKLSVKIKARTFEAYVTSIFLYNSEIWTLSQSDEKAIDSFQRRILRSCVLNIRWPTIVKNEDVYTLTNQKPWSKTIAHRRLSWLGHLARLPEEVPARQALNHALQPTKLPVGRPRTTWIKIIRKQLRETLNLTIEEAIELAQDRNIWRDLLRRCAM